MMDVFHALLGLSLSSVSNSGREISLLSTLFCVSPSLFYYDLTDARKGVYPYEFNTLGNWNYVGTMPSLQLFLPGGIHGAPYVEGEEEEKFSKADLQDDETKLRQQRIDIIRWWKLKVSENYVWNNREELIAYCENDVKILAEGCLKFRENFMEVTKTTQWKEKNPAKGGQMIGE